MSVSQVLSFPKMKCLMSVTNQIAELEGQIESMNRALTALKQKKERLAREKKKAVEKRPPPPPVASSSKPTPKTNGKIAPPVNRKKVSKKPVEDNDVLSFEQKKELSDTIGKLDGQKLEKVIQIIHEGVPEIRDVRVLQLYTVLVNSHATEHGGDRARDRYPASVGSYEAVQLRHPSHAPASCEAGPDGQGHGYWWPQAEEHGRGRRGREDSCA